MTALLAVLLAASALLTARGALIVTGRAPADQPELLAEHRAWLSG